MSSFNATPPLSTVECEYNFTMNNHVYKNNAAAAVINVPLATFVAVINAVVILTVVRTTSLHRPANILLCSLAFGDLVVGTFVQPVMVVRLLYSNECVDCCLYNKLYKLSMYSTTIALGSMVQICVMCWDRYKAVSRPFHYRSTVTNKKMTVITVTAWVTWFTSVAVNLALPDDVKRVYASLVLGSFITICVVSQIATLKSIRVQSNQIAPAAPHANTFAREKKMAITLRWILGAAFFSALPMLMYSVSVVIFGRESFLNTLLFPWAIMMLFVNSALNPLIYFWRHSNMRSAALEFISGC